MHAIIETGSKQYKVKEGDQIDIELLEQEPGTAVKFDNVLLISDGKATQVGSPGVAGAAVTGTLLENVKGQKIRSLKFKRRKNCRTKFGHRQKLSRVKITGIESKGGK